MPSNVCLEILGMKEDDMCDLLKFEKKMFRGRIGILKNDKFVQLRLKMETGPDGKTQKVNYYYINYKVSFLNLLEIGISSFIFIC